MHVRGQNVRWTYNMKGNSLSVDETEKDLGIWISSDMKCSDQCLYLFIYLISNSYSSTQEKKKKKKNEKNNKRKHTHTEITIKPE